MNRSHILLYPLLATALFLSACAGEPATLAEKESETAPSSNPTPEPQEIDAYDHPVVYISDRINFDFDSAELRPDAIVYSDRLVKWLNEFHPDMSLLIEGHTDVRGPNEYNLELGCRRAKAMREALIERGIAPERLGTISYGEKRPGVLGDNEYAWAQNRRAVMAEVLQRGQNMSEYTCDKR